jgi:hypothetical protein
VCVDVNTGLLGQALFGSRFAHTKGIELHIFKKCPNSDKNGKKFV